MSSPSEYRALRVDNKKWAKGWYFYQSGKSYILEPCGPAKMPDYQLCFIGKDSIIEVIPGTVAQSTGLKDTNGVDLDWYAGDIIQKGEIIRAITVDWEHGMRFMLGKHILCKQDGINGIKIGDIHTTPKLLEGK